MTSSVDFGVALNELRDATSVVRQEADGIKFNVDTLNTVCDIIASSWQSPAGQTCVDLQTTFKNAIAGLVDLLDEMINRMHQSYLNYSDAEGKNTANVQSTTSVKGN